MPRLCSTFPFLQACLATFVTDQGHHVTLSCQILGLEVIRIIRTARPHRAGDAHPMEHLLVEGREEYIAQRFMNEICRWMPQRLRELIE